MSPTTYALVPGAGGDASYWDLVVSLLRERGEDAVAVDLPAGDDTAGWSAYADAIVGAVGDGPNVVVVAQSLAGFSAPIACDRLDVDRIVLLNAMIPRPGETGAEWWPNTGQPDAMREHLAAIGLPPETAEDDVLVYFHDVPADVRAAAFERGEPQQSWTPMEEPWPLDAWPDVPTRVLAGRDDRLFPVGFQRRVARDRLGIEIEEVDGGHLVALSRPDELVERLEDDRPGSTGITR